jgi:hypothetical protein
MKAIIEINMPDSCRECELLKSEYDVMDRCIITGSLVSQTQTCRNGDCPLKPV